MKRKTRSTLPVSAENCPCGLPAPYATCCGRYHAGTPAPTAEALMRSRYSAYTLGLAEYLQATWASGTRPATLDLLTPPQPQWLGLTVLSHTDTGDTATVEFIARCKINGRAQRMQEKSRFVRRAEGDVMRWYYVDGEFAES